MGNALAATQKQLGKMGMEVEVASTKEGDEIKLFVRRGRSQLKVEVNHVFRGTVLPIQTLRLVETARSLFTTDLSLPVLATPELYGSKLVAAMDRQHPRDLFDVKAMLDRYGLNPEIVECFVCYLAGHNRPVHEVLFSRENNMAPAFENEFAGMTRTPVTLDELLEVRKKLRRELPKVLTSAQKQFLLGLVRGEPDWSLMTCPHLAEMSAIRWKTQNLSKLRKSNPLKFRHQEEELRVKFSEL